MRTVSATFEVLTPMFLGDADNMASALRPSSIKAELVFWWRALHAANIIAEVMRAPGGSLNKGLAELHRCEVKLFGGPGGGANPRQSTVHVSARWTQKPQIFGPGQLISQAFGSNGQSGGVNYLGYGLVTVHGNVQSANETGTIPDKSCFGAKGRFVLDLVFKGNDEVGQREVERALKIMGFLGGLGSRKRRGWGSLTLLSIEKEETKGRERGEQKEIWAVPKDLPAWKGEIRVLVDLKAISRTAGDLPLSAFGAGSSACIWKAGFKNAIEAMEAVGHGYQLYRAWGHRDPKDGVHKIGGEQARQNFKPEHDWYKAGLSASDRGKHGLVAEKMPPRGYLGLPLPFNAKAGKIVDAGAPFGRRASPLMFHITKIGNEYFPVATHFGNMFLPEVGTGKNKGVKIKINGAGAHPFEPDSGVVADYFKGVVRNSPGVDAKYFDADPDGNILIGDAS